MHQQGFNFVYSNIYIKAISLAVLIIFAFTFLHSPASAQEIPDSVKKNVVKNYKANFTEVLPSGSSNCSLKLKGDANCDGLVNEFDLSIWQIEYNSLTSPKRSDFNSDSFVNFVDYGIWRNTFYPQKTSGLRQFLSGVFSLFTLQSSLFTAKAQENNSNAPQVNSSNSFIGSSGNSFVANSLANGNTQQVNFNKDARITSSQLFSNNGLLLAGVSYLDSGATIISTQSEGIPIQVSKSATGAIFQSYKNPDGSLIALKSWPSQESYDRNDPPLSVTLPGRDNKTRLTLNIQANGSGILNETDLNGKLLNQRRLLGNGLYNSINAKTGAVTQSLNAAGFTNLTIPNNLGGNTSYYFANNTLVLINQTDSAKNFYSATPQGNIDSWELLSVVNGIQSKKIVPDPIKAVNSNTPSPSTLINQWNYYSNAAKTQDPAIDFADSFNSTSNTLKSQVQKADQVYSINLVPPQVLGIVKEAKAQQNNPSIGNLPGGISVVTTNSDIGQFEYRDATGRPADVEGNRGFNVNISSWTPTEGPLANQVVSAASVEYFNSSYQVTSTHTVVSDLNPTTENLTANQVAVTATGATTSTTPTEPITPTTPETIAPPTVPVVTEIVTETITETVTTVTTVTTETTISPPPGQDELTTGQALGGETFSQSFNNQNNTITAEFGNGNVQVTDLNNGNVSFTYNESGPLNGTTVTINAEGFVDSFTLDGGTYSVSPDTGIITDSDGNIVSHDEHVSSFGQSVIDINDLANEYDDPQTAINDNFCFLAGTLISTPSGSVPIEKLKPGMKIYSFNEKTLKKEISNFSGLDVNFVDEYLIINNKVKTTTYHPFYTKNSDQFILKKAGELNIGELLIDEEKNPVAVSSIQKINSPVTVYNLLEVTPNNNFFAQNLLVHNYGDEVSETQEDPDAEINSESFDSVMASADAFADIANSVADAVDSSGDWADSWSTGPSNDTSESPDDSSTETDDSSTNSDDDSDSDSEE